MHHSSSSSSDNGKIPVSCSDLLANGYKNSGIYLIKGSSAIESTYCNFKHPGKVYSFFIVSSVIEWNCKNLKYCFIYLCCTELNKVIGSVYGLLLDQTQNTNTRLDEWLMDGSNGQRLVEKGRGLEDKSSQPIYHGVTKSSMIQNSNCPTKMRKEKNIWVNLRQIDK